MDIASHVLEVLMWLVSVASVGLNVALLRRGYQHSDALYEERRNGVLRIIADHDIRQAWHRLGISGSLVGVCSLFLSLPNNTDGKALLLKLLVLGICVHVGWKSWDDRVTSRRVNEKLDALEVSHGH
jgi:hypothetical protein